MDTITKINDLHKLTLEKRGDRTKLFDSTSLSYYQLCPRKFFYRFELRLVAKGFEAPPLTMGKGIHTFIEIYTETKDIKSAAIAFKKDIENPKSKIGGEGIKNYNTKTGLTALAHYIEHYADDPYPPKVVNGKKLLEVGFAIDLGSGILWGRIDRIGTDTTSKDPNAYIVLDHKHTTQSISEYKQSKYVMSPQITNYMLACREMFGYSPSHGIIDIIRISEGNIHERFARVYIERTELDLDTAKEELRFTFAVIQQAREYGICGFPKNAPEACLNWGRKCEYYALCFGHTDDLVTLLEYGYEETTWDPFKVVDGETSCSLQN